MEVKLESVHDLTDADVLQKSGLSENSLTGGDTTATRQIATEAKKRSYRALLVPSAAASGWKNLFLFLDKASARPNVLSSRLARFDERAR